MLKRIHHIDFVVKDLDLAVEKYRHIFGIEPLPREELKDRGVELVRFRIGESWVILVEPKSDESPVMDYLKQNGEGFFHIAYEVDDVDEAAWELRQKGVALQNETPRLGVDGWRLLDIETAETLGAMSQLVEQGRHEEGW